MLQNNNSWTENVVFETKSFFMDKSCYILEICIFYILNQYFNYKSCDIMMSIRFWGRKYFLIYLLSFKSVGHETWPTNIFIYEKYFSERFSMIWKTGSNIQGFFDLWTYCNELKINYDEFLIRYILWMVQRDNQKY